jgi:hypothetical protein
MKVLADDAVLHSGPFRPLKHALGSLVRHASGEPAPVTQPGGRNRSPWERVRLWENPTPQGMAARLRRAVTTGDPDALAKALAHPQIDTNLADSDGHTALTLAIERNDQAAFDALVPHLRRTAGQRLPIGVAARHGRLSMLQTLLDHPMGATHLERVATLKEAAEHGHARAANAVLDTMTPQAFADAVLKIIDLGKPAVLSAVVAHDAEREQPRVAALIERLASEQRWAPLAALLQAQPADCVEVPPGILLSCLSTEALTPAQYAIAAELGGRHACRLADGLIEALRSMPDEERACTLAAIALGAAATLDLEVEGLAAFRDRMFDGAADVQGVALRVLERCASLDALNDNFKVLSHSWSERERAGSVRSTIVNRCLQAAGGTISGFARTQPEVAT